MINRGTPTTETLNWDLSGSTNPISQVNWPPEHTADVLHFSNVVVNVTLPQGYAIQGWQASKVYVTRPFRQGSDKGVINELTVRTQPLTPGEAHAEALRLAEQFGLEASAIEAWRRRTEELPPHHQSNFSTSRSLPPRRAGRWP